MMDGSTLEDALEAISERYEGLGVRCDAYAHDDEIYLDVIRRDRTDPSTKGRGAQAIEELCALADSIGQPMGLCHMHDETGLGAYYARFGFTYCVTPNGNPELVTMRRMPIVRTAGRD